MPKERHDWQGKAILHPDHGQELEARAADLEFKDRLSRDNAESQAYREYRRRHHMAAAAHHLRGMKSANGSGDQDEARKHGAMYEMHMGKLGEEPWREPSRELKAAMHSDDRESVHKFKAHAGDQFVVDEHNAKKATAELSKSLGTLALKAKITELLVKAFPSDPGKPVGSHLEPQHREKIKASAKTSEQLQAVPPHHDLTAFLNATETALGNEHRPLGKPIKMTSSKRIPNDQPMVPNKAQAGVVAGLKVAPPETHVLVDQMAQQGAQFTQPPKFVPALSSRVPGSDPGQPYNQADLNRQAFSTYLQGENRRMSTQHPELGAGNPMTAFEVPGPAMIGTNRAWDSPSNVRNSEYLDSSFWSAVSRHAGLDPVTRTLQATTNGVDPIAQKAEPGQMAPPPGMAAPAKPQLHSTVEGFMGGLKALPKGSPERGRFITAHMSHPAFIGALQAHPQGKAIHGQLTSFMNSTANAGPKAPMQVTAKKLLEVVDLVKAEGHPRYVPGTPVSDGERNLIVLKVHPAQGPEDKHVYTLRDPVDNTLSHAFESRLEPSKEHK